MDRENSDKELIRTTGTVVAKSILYVCLVVTAVFWFSSCQLDQEVINQCEESCSSGTTYMESVTSRECVCASKKDNPMVLPR